MAAQTTAIRTRRPQHVETDDAVLARVLQITEWAQKNVAIVAGVALALVLLIGGLIWYRVERGNRMEEAAVAFMQVEQTSSAGDPTIAIRDLLQYIEEHDGTPYAEEARLILGRLYLESGQPPQSIQVLEPVADRLEDSPVGPQAGLLLAAAQQASGDPAAALDTYLRVSETDELFRRQEALLSAAILRQELGDNAGAVELYRELVETAEEGSTERTTFEMRLAEAEARAAAAPAQ